MALTKQAFSTGIFLGLTVVLNGWPFVTVVIVAKYNWGQIRAHPARWGLQSATLGFPLVVIAITLANPCERMLPVPQLGCPGALLWAPPVFWSLYGAQLVVAALLARASPRATLWIPLQVLFVQIG